MFNFLFGTTKENKNQKEDNTVDPLHKELVSKWRSFLNKIGIQVVDSDNEMYDFMSAETRYSIERHLYFKVHTICPWKRNATDVKRIDQEGYSHEVHLCDSLNLFPQEGTKQVSILLGVAPRKGRVESRFPHLVTISQCQECDHLNLYEDGTWGCPHYSNLLVGYTPDRYSQLIEIANQVGIPIHEKDILDSLYLPYTPSISIPDEKGSYLYVISMSEERGIVIHVGTTSSLSSFLWNINDQYPDIKVELLIPMENASEIVKKINKRYCSQSGWIVGKNPKWIVKEITKAI